jgi:cytochrome c553
MQLLASVLNVQVCTAAHRQQGTNRPTASSKRFIGMHNKTTSHPLAEYKKLDYKG